MLGKLSVKDLDVSGKKVFVRVDFNVPLDSDRNVSDDNRIVAALPTLKHLLDGRASLIVASHLGRPKGQRKEEFSLAPVAERLSSLLDRPVLMAGDCIGSEVRDRSKALKAGDVLLLENLRFHKGEEDNDPEFARGLAELCELYVNDAFGTCHRAHASMAGLPGLLKTAAAGFLLDKELEYLGEALEEPKRPYMALIGGAKISGKIDVIRNLKSRVDLLVVGGGMTYTFQKAQGHEIGDSLLEKDKVDLAGELLEEFSNSKAELILPVDTRVTREIKEGSQTRVVKTGGIEAGWSGVDIGPETEALISEKIRSAGTVVWNGPMGIFEIPEFAGGTLSIARALAESDCVSVVGGGDTAAAVRKAGLASGINHISTGGGASLDLLGGKKLPGIEALTDVE